MKFSDLIARPRFYVAADYASLGDHDKAIAWPRRSLEARDSDILNIRNYPEFDSMSADPRFATLLAQIGFPK